MAMPSRARPTQREAARATPARGGPSCGPGVVACPARRCGAARCGGRRPEGAGPTGGAACAAPPSRPERGTEAEAEAEAGAGAGGVPRMRQATGCAEDDGEVMTAAMRRWKRTVRSARWRCADGAAALWRRRAGGGRGEPGPARLWRAAAPALCRRVRPRRERAARCPVPLEPWPCRRRRVPTGGQGARRHRGARRVTLLVLVRSVLIRSSPVPVLRVLIARARAARLRSYPWPRQPAPARCRRRRCPQRRVTGDRIAACPAQPVRPGLAHGHGSRRSPHGRYGGSTAAASRRRRDASCAGPRPTRRAAAPVSRPQNRK